MNKNFKFNLVLGIMSGTSLDGVDYALCRVDFGEISLIKLWSVPYTAALKSQLMAAAQNELSSYALAQLHHDLGRFYADRAPRVKCDYIGLHGQTIFHKPDPKTPATFQIGDPAYLRVRFGVPVVNQFRNMDMALGGQGAPLATLFHRQVFSRKNLNVAVNNLGGISNVTYLPATHHLSHQHVLSFDTGPANMLIDAAVKKITKGKQSFDKEGHLGFRGLPSPKLIEKWMGHRFFRERPPKSTGREEFGEDFFQEAFSDCKKEKLSSYDIVATFTDFTAVSIANAYSRFLPKFPDVVILAGGGACNPYLVERLRAILRLEQWREWKKKGFEKSQRLQPVSITTTDALGWPAQSIESAAFALLAFRTIHSLSGNIPETTGARHAAVLGQF